MGKIIQGNGCTMIEFFCCIDKTTKNMKTPEMFFLLFKNHQIALLIFIKD